MERITSTIAAVACLALLCGVATAIADQANASPSIGGGVDQTVVDYTVSLDSFTFNGKTYPAETFTFVTPGLLSSVAASPLLAPVTYDG